MSSYTDNAVNNPADPRGSAAFIELDYIVSSFRDSFPSHLKDPIVDNVVDNHLYTACLTSLAWVCFKYTKCNNWLSLRWRATIMLHDPHTEVRLSSCVSSRKVLTAARAILDLIYNIWSTSFDITLLDSFCSVCLDFFTHLKHPLKHVIFSSVGSSVVGSLLDFYRLPWQHKLLIRYPCCEGRLTFYSEPYSYLIIST